MESQLKKPLKFKKPNGLINVNGQRIDRGGHDVLIGMPVYKWNGIPKETSDCLASCVQYMGEKGYKVAYNKVTGAALARNRNNCVEEARQANARWLMFIDADMVWKPDWIERLMAHDVDIVSGLCCKKTAPYTSTVGVKLGNKYNMIDDFPLGELIECDATGTAFLLIKMSVFDKIQKPYFAFPPNGDGVLGEDLYFCQIAQDAGFKIHVDTDLLVGHLGTYAYTFMHRLAYLDATGENEQPRSDGDEG